MEVSTSLSWQWQAKKRPRGPLDPFFEEGDAICCYAAKQLSLEPDVEETPTRVCLSFSKEIIRPMTQSVQIMEVSTSLSWQWQAKKRPRGPLDPFFEEGDAICCYAAKQLSLEPDVEETPTSVPSFPCCISGCSETLDSILSYEVHYNSMHRHVCSECHRTFPSNHLLEIHLQESHDPLFDLVPGNKYVCLTLGCGVKFSSPKSRRNHMVKHHKFPANFRFNRTKPQKPVAKHQPDGGGDEMDIGSQAEKENIPQQLPGRVFKYKVPQSICFGQGSVRGFHRPRARRKPKHWHQSNVEMDTTVQIENVNLEVLKDALGDG